MIKMKQELQKRIEELAADVQWAKDLAAEPTHIANVMSQDLRVIRELCYLQQIDPDGYTELYEQKCGGLYRE